MITRVRISETETEVRWTEEDDRAEAWKTARDLEIIYEARRTRTEFEKFDDRVQRVHEQRNRGVYNIPARDERTTDASCTQCGRLFKRTPHSVSTFCSALCRKANRYRYASTKPHESEIVEHHLAIDFEFPDDDWLFDWDGVAVLDPDVVKAYKELQRTPRRYGIPPK